MVHRSVVGVQQDSVVRGQPTVVRLIVTWQHPVSRSIQPVGVLAFDGRKHSFCYIENALRVQDFRPLLGFPKLREFYESDHLFPLFAQRVMDPRRPDYSRYVHRLGLDSDATPWEQIARSGGRRQGDTLQLFPVPTVTGNDLSCAFLVHGIRHVVGRVINAGGKQYDLVPSELEAALAALKPGDRLQLLDEPENPANPKAILAAGGSGIPLGWVPDLLVEDLHALRQVSDVQVSVIQVNGPDASWHLRLVARLSAYVPEGFPGFFVGPKWKPLCDEAQS